MNLSDADRATLTSFDEAMAAVSAQKPADPNKRVNALRRVRDEWLPQTEAIDIRLVNLVVARQRNRVLSGAAQPPLDLGALAAQIP